MSEEKKNSSATGKRNGIDSDFEEYLKTLTEEEQKEIAASKSRRNGDVKLTVEEKKLFGEFIKVL